MLKYYAREKIFSLEEETMFANYLITATSHNYGLSPAMARILAYEFATANQREIPEAWNRDSTVGEEWLIDF